MAGRTRARAAAQRASAWTCELLGMTHARRPDPRPRAVQGRRQGPVRQGTRDAPRRRPRAPGGALAEGRADGRCPTASCWPRCSKREDPRDAFVSPRFASLDELPRRRAASAPRACAAPCSCWRCAPTCASSRCAATSTRGCASSTTANTTRSCSPPPGSRGSAWRRASACVSTPPTMLPAAGQGALAIEVPRRRARVARTARARWCTARAGWRCTPSARCRARSAAAARCRWPRTRTGGDGGLQLDAALGDAAVLHRPLLRAARHAAVADAAGAERAGRRSGSRTVRRRRRGLSARALIPALRRCAPLSRGRAEQAHALGRRAARTRHRRACAAADRHRAGGRRRTGAAAVGAAGCARAGDVRQRQRGRSTSCGSGPQAHAGRPACSPRPPGRARPRRCAPPACRTRSWSRRAKHRPTIPSALWPLLQGHDWRGAGSPCVRGDDGRDWLADRFCGRRCSRARAGRLSPVRAAPDSAGRRLLRARWPRRARTCGCSAVATRCGIWPGWRRRRLAARAPALASHARIADSARGWASARASGWPRPQPACAGPPDRGRRGAGRYNPTRRERAATHTRRTPVPRPRAAPPPALPVDGAGAGWRWRCWRWRRWPARRWSSPGPRNSASASWSTELVKRQQDSGAQAGEAQLLAQQAQETARESAAKLALLEARVAEASMQRIQLEDLIQSLSRSRDENVLADLEASIRVALAADRDHRQRRAAGGRAEAGRRAPGALQPAAAGTRAARGHAGPGTRARGRRRRHLVAGRSASTMSCARSTNCRCWPRPERRGRRRARAGVGAHRRRSRRRSAAWHDVLGSALDGDAAATCWAEIRGLVRVTRDRPPRSHAASRPSRPIFLRENLKLRLLNARLALLSRQFDDRAGRPARRACRRSSAISTAARGASPTPPSWCARSARSRARSRVPRPDATLAALAAAAAGR